MKKIKSLALLALFVSTTLFTSCSSDDSESDNETPEASQGDYWPAALNNQWVFKLDGVQQPPMKIISINSIGGSTYYTFDTLFGQGSMGTVGSATTRMKKNSGDYYLKIEDLNLNLGNNLTATMTGFEYVILKDYLAVGQTWNGVYTQTTNYSDRPN